MRRCFRRVCTGVPAEKPRHASRRRGKYLRIEKINPAWIHPMHGGSFKREVAPRFFRALREEPFAYQGMLRGRELPIEARAA